MKRILLFAVRYALAAIGTVVMLGALVAGMLSPTAAGTLSWALLELVGVVILIPGLHIAIEWDLR